MTGMTDQWSQAQQAESEYWAQTPGSTYQCLHELTEHYRRAYEGLDLFVKGEQLEAIEIGSGPMGIGFLPVYAAQKCRRIIGIEPLAVMPLELTDPALCEYLQTLRSRVEMLGVKAECLPLEGKQFDLGCCINVLDHTDQPGEVLSELARVIRPGGVLIIAVHTRSLLGLAKWQIIRRLHKNELFYRAHPHAWLWSQVNMMLRRDWELLWCDRPALTQRLLGHQQMNTWFLRRR